MKIRYLSLLFYFSCDIILSEISLFIAISSSKDGLHTEFPYIVWPLIVMFSFYILKIYNILWEYSNIAETMHIVPATALATGVFFLAQTAVQAPFMGYKSFFILFVLINIFAFITRLMYKQIVSHSSITNAKKPETKPLISGNVMIIGAGSAAGIIINEFSLKKEYSKCKIKCAIDDNPYLKGNYISGVKIIGGREYIVSAAKKYDIKTIIFAIPNCDKAERTKILNICQETDCELKIIPSICKIYSESELSNLSSSIRKVEIEDLLGREVIDVSADTSLDYVMGKTVLVTGGGGTIGSELCRQISSHNPEKLIIFDIYENNAYEIQNELRFKFPQLEIITLIGSVRDSKRLDYLFRTYKPQIIYHAAAHKHVPLMEESPNETIKNNVFGTLKTAQCADRYGAEKMVLISTDKAVNPTNIMGASKRICEMIVQTFNSHSNTDFVAVRFGNVLGSNGSVIPLFKEQIKHGGPVTVTDPNIIRYFMTIPEAVSLVLKAGINAKGGEIFVLDMGKPVKILDLAENLIKLSGFTPYKDIDIIFTGLRPGEKLYEELLMNEEGLTATENNLIYIGRPIDIDETLLHETLDEMKTVMYDENADIRALVKKIVPTYINE